MYKILKIIMDEKSIENKRAIVVDGKAYLFDLKTCDFVSYKHNRDDEIKNAWYVNGIFYTLCKRIHQSLQIYNLYIWNYNCLTRTIEDKYIIFSSRKMIDIMETSNCLYIAEQEYSGTEIFVSYYIVQKEKVDILDCKMYGNFLMFKSFFGKAYVLSNQTIYIFNGKLVLYQTFDIPLIKNFFIAENSTIIVSQGVNENIYTIFHLDKISQVEKPYYLNNISDCGKFGVYNDLNTKVVVNLKSWKCRQILKCFFIIENCFYKIKNEKFCKLPLDNVLFYVLPIKKTEKNVPLRVFLESGIFDKNVMSIVSGYIN